MSPPSRFPPWRGRAYVSAGYRLVEGWLDPLEARIIDVLLSAQETHGLPGSVGEIGVHHGACPQRSRITSGVNSSELHAKTSIGVGKYLLGGGRLKPFLITRNEVTLSREGEGTPYVEELRRQAAAFFDKSSRLYGSHVEILGTGFHSTTRYRARHFVRSRPALKAVAKRVLRR